MATQTARRVSNIVPIIALLVVIAITIAIWASAGPGRSCDASAAVAYARDQVGAPRDMDVIAHPYAHRSDASRYLITVDAGDQTLIGRVACTPDRGWYTEQPWQQTG